MQTIVRGGRPRDLIALAWYRIGFRPRESLVLVGLHGPKRRTGMVVRVDLPPPEQREATLHGVVRLLRRSQVRQVAVLVVSDAEGQLRAGPDGEPLMPQRDLVGWLRRELPRRGLAVFDVLGVGPSTFRSYLCSDPRCCPFAGQPLEEIGGSELAAHMVLEGRSVLAGEAELVADVRPDPRCLSADRLDRVGPVDPVRELSTWREQLAAGASGPADPARLLVALRDTRLRDAVMITLIPGSGLLPEALLAGGPMTAVEDLWERRPDDDLAERGRRLLAALARVAPVGERAEVLSVLAWLAWWLNEAARCRLLVDLALTDRPEHRLAGLVAQLLAGGIPPTWLPMAAPVADRRHPDGETG